MQQVVKKKFLKLLLNCIHDKVQTNGAFWSFAVPKCTADINAKEFMKFKSKLVKRNESVL